MQVTALPFFTPLVKDYLANFDTSPIGEYFAVPPDAPYELMRQLIDERLIRERALPESHRKTVVDSIAHTHATIGETSEAVLANLKLLESKTTLAVVTGQQLGILGGPMYAFYKAFAAIQLSKKLSEQFQEFAFVPVFWLESEDHDLEEVAGIHILNKESELANIRYAPYGVEDVKQWRKQVGGIVVGGEPRAKFFEELRLTLPPTGFTDEVLALYERCYAPGKTFVEGFAALLSYYFGDDGLLLFDASTPEIKALGHELFRKEVETSPELSEKIVLQSTSLEETYHAQVKPRALNLFYITEDGDRLSLMEHEKTASQTERTFFVKGTRRTFTLKELLRDLDSHPERFSPNVVMRPLFQDTLLPTVSYVAGPGEISYFAQFRPGYEWAGLPMPLIRPRMSATIVEERFERTFSKFHISVEDILVDGRGRNKALLDAVIDSPLAAQFDAALTEIDKTLEALRPQINAADPTLDGALNSLKGKVLTATRDFQSKTLTAERKRYTLIKTKLDMLYAALLPDDELQERELNLVYFLNKYGLGFLERLKEAIGLLSLDFREHHVILVSKLTPKATISSDGGVISEAGRTSMKPMPLTAFQELQ